MGCARREKVMMMEKIWMLLPDIQAMKHMKAMFFTGAVALANNACRQNSMLLPVSEPLHCVMSLDACSRTVAWYLLFA
jgi:hypothetical protein